MPHEYSNFKNKNIPYAKVGRRVFGSLFNAEEYCTRNELNVNTAIEYRDDQELKAAVQEIAQYQKAILREILRRMEAHSTSIHEEIERDKTALDTCHCLEDAYYRDKLTGDIGRGTGAYEARRIVWEALEELENLTGWHDR